MRLKKIHVSGFKSFVDPTAITIPADMTGIIGPNGCGKSNVIDAVRWVMGESSARKLRGDSMSDVIFNGSEARKPVGKASVELIFDNTDGKSAQVYARFSEISVKRTLSRDGTSEYLLNKAQCRRRDITDLFRGTGLGHRSYSIIEQGMVSRIVEARPEELRAFVEEAAGISHYKDRRRETETRMRHTRENLSRVEDIRKELDTQLRRLQRQAQAARRYKKLKEEERELNGQLLALRYLGQKAAVEEQAVLTARAQTDVESHLVQQRSLENQIEGLRANEMASQQEVSDRQAAFYAAGAEVASLEQAIEHAKETGEQQRAEFERLEVTLEEIKAEYQHDEDRIEGLATEVSSLISQREEVTAISTRAVDQQHQCEHAYDNWQDRWNEFTQQVTTPIKDQEVQRSRIEQLESADEKAQERLARLDEEIGMLLNEEERLEVDIARSAVVQGEADLSEAERQVEKSTALIVDMRDQITARSEKLDEQRQRMHSARGRLESLQELQQTSQDKDKDEAYLSWLDQRGLAHAPALAGELRVAPGWERAADAVFGSRLTGLGVGDLPTILSSDSEMPRQDMFFVESGKTAHSANSQTLLAYVSSDRYDLQPLLAGVFVADDLPEALSRRDQLQQSESIVTKSVVVGVNWAHVPRGQGATAGVLEREEELSRLGEEVPAIESRVSESEQELEGFRANLDTLETQQKSARDRAAVILQKLNEDRQAYADRQARFDQIEGRRQQLADESEEIVSELSRTGSELDEARRHFAIAEDETGALERQREALLTEKEALTRKLSEARVQAQAAQDRRHEAELALQHSQASLESHRSSLSRLQAQSSRMQQRYEQLSQQLSTGEDPGVAMGDRLQILLTQRSEAEQALAEGRNRHSTIEQEIRQAQGALSECEQEVASARENLESKRLKDQELAVRLQTLEEQIAQDEYVLSHILENLPQEAEEAEWTTRSERLAQKIANIGPVNLVAIEEFEEQAERKEYLDSQHADLIEALETLSGVIRKIDRETRDRFKSTFDSLNQGFQIFFPQLFGGGNAVLQLTEEVAGRGGYRDGKTARKTQQHDSSFVWR